jgi:hypothetical protein
MNSGQSSMSTWSEALMLEASPSTTATEPGLNSALQGEGLQPLDSNDDLEAKGRVDVRGHGLQVRRDGLSHELLHPADGPQFRLGFFRLASGLRLTSSAEANPEREIDSRG